MITKKAFSFILLAIFSFNIAGYFISFKIVQYQIKKEIKTAIKKGLSEDKLTIITLNKEDLSQLVWEEKNKEFYFKGELYDVVKMEEKQDTVIYHCINDEQEEKLFEHLDEHIKEHVPTIDLKKKNSKKTNLDSIQLYLSDQFSQTLILANTTTLFYQYYLSHPSAYIEINSPPPQLL